MVRAPNTIITEPIKLLSFSCSVFPLSTLKCYMCDNSMFTWVIQHFSYIVPITPLINTSINFPLHSINAKIVHHCDESPLTYRFQADNWWIFQNLFRTFHRLPVPLPSGRFECVLRVWHILYMLLNVFLKERGLDKFREPNEFIFNRKQSLVSTLSNRQISNVPFYVSFVYCALHQIFISFVRLSPERRKEILCVGTMPIFGAAINEENAGNVLFFLIKYE